jgi:hypothetical protein
MLKADHNTKVATLVSEDPRFAALKGHLHLMGNVYVDAAIATREMIEDAALENPAVLDLPVLTANNRDGFFRKPEVCGLVAKKIASIKGVSENTSDYMPLLRSLVSSMEGFSNSKMEKLARKVFATRDRKAVNVYANYSMRDVPVSGLDAMHEFELGHTASSNLGDIDINTEEEHQDLLDVGYGGMVLD